MYICRIRLFILPEEEMENRNQRLLLVEDDQNFGSVLKVYLEMNGYDVCWVDDGARAFDVYSNGSFHLCILDIMLPGQDGFQLARQRQIPLLQHI